MSGIIKIYRPDLTEKERLMREQSIKTALQLYGKEIFESEVNSSGNVNTSRTIGKEPLLDRQT